MRNELKENFQGSLITFTKVINYYTWLDYIWIMPYTYIVRGHIIGSMENDKQKFKNNNINTIIGNVITRKKESIKGKKLREKEG